MKRFVVVPLVMMLSAVSSYAAENSNPFVLPAPPPVAGMTLPSLDEPLSQSFTENRSVFDLLEVVGRTATFAVLRYPMAGSGATTGVQGVSYRELIVKKGQASFIGGRSFKAVLPSTGTNVLLVDSKNGKVLWEGDLSAPKIYHVNPNIADYQYTPPVSAGTGVGQATSGSTVGQSGAGLRLPVQSPGMPGLMQ